MARLFKDMKIYKITQIKRTPRKDYSLIDWVNIDWNKTDEEIAQEIIKSKMEKYDLPPESFSYKNKKNTLSLVKSRRKLYAPDTVIPPYLNWEEIDWSRPDEEIAEKYNLSVRTVKLQRRMLANEPIYAKSLNWYKKAKLVTASMNVMVADYEYPTKKETILDLCFLLENQLFYKTNFFNQLNDFEKQIWKERKMPEFITPDGFEVFQTTGIINVYLAGLPERLIPTLRKYITETLTKENIKFNIKETLDDSGMFKSKVMRINILDTNANQTKDTPPELNMANTNARLVLEDILGYDLSNYTLEIPAFELIHRINNTTNEILEQKERGWSRDWGQGQVEMISGGYDSKQIKHSLNTMKEIAEWAINHNYKRLIVQ